MGRFTIEILASQCGVTTQNLRSWQRYGLIKARKDEKGHRYYDFSHISQVNLIVQWIGKGVPLRSIQALMMGEEIRKNSGWFAYQEQLYALCEAGNLSKLRGFIWKIAREVPPHVFIDEFIRPFRLWITAGRQPGLEISRVRLDTALIEYAVFAVSNMRKRAGGTMLILGTHFNDTVELWLEAIRYAGEGFQVEVLAGRVSQPDLSREPYDHILVWAGRPLNAAQKARHTAWLEQGVPVAITGPGVRPMMKKASRDGDLKLKVPPAANQNPSDSPDIQTA
ncbi:MerR family transcriptional regulator [Atlantibacter sp.]|uniref:MerR family transcriptional regulator n=1 Tax=Atlantibacter sp. TaxID=1903473 RepID=UPI0028AC474A|nr:MerR family transcriptional regulator [Atlantibacter sp.]